MIIFAGGAVWLEMIPLVNTKLIAAAFGMIRCTAAESIVDL